MARLVLPATENILAILRRLTPRDRTLIDLLGRHQVLTCTQITAMLFGSERAGRTRINTLVGLDVLARFRACVRPGSQAYRYTLGPTGAYLHAAATGQPAPKPSATTRRITELATNTHLNHRIAVNDFFTRLHAAARRTDAVTVVDWLPEHEAAGHCGGTVRPDGGATIRIDEHEIRFWFEHDTGSETLERLAAKIGHYTDAPTETRLVLFELPGPDREAHFHARAAGIGTDLTIATTTLDRSTSPTEPIWWPTGAARYTDLAGLANSGGPLT